ncbi:glutathione S-transferase A4-like isoform X2 [Sapajus apella]|uniref:glutathione transferase n=1 Tax=Sapajus apella TaxID=9515 RepID=A0A6J3JKU6_SAPAP|nr:glutathione S-transferase A4-like isoform X2 [Sapajus apella]
MAAKPKLYYFHGRGRMESIRWLLAAAGVEFEEEFLETREQYEKLQKDGRLLFGQVPLVEVDGMMLTQTRAILSYLAAKFNFYGKDLKERVRIDMYVDGTLDLMAMIMLAPFQRPEEKQETLASIVQKAKTRYFPVFEKAFKTRISNIPTIKKFLQPGSQRKPPPDTHYANLVSHILQF